MLCFHELPGGGNAASRNADMDMGMKRKFLSPGVKDGQDSRLCTHKTRISAESQQGILHAPELKIKQELLVVSDQGIQLMRDRKDDMKVSDALDQFRIAFQFPLLFKRSLAAGTGAVVAGDRVDQGMPTVFTVTDGITKLPGLAPDDGTGSPALLFGQGMGLPVLRKKPAEYRPDRIRISRSHRDFSRSFHFRCRGQDRLPWKRGTYAPSLL